MAVTAVSEDEVTLDGNHPLAGLDLTFALTLDRVE
jgi:FKBP-type peptidyl-prolyl cis-trans isomerase 2